MFSYGLSMALALFSSQGSYCVDAQCVVAFPTGFAYTFSVGPTAQGDDIFVTVRFGNHVLSQGRLFCEDADKYVRVLSPISYADKRDVADTFSQDISNWSSNKFIHFATMPRTFLDEKGSHTVSLNLGFNITAEIAYDVSQFNETRKLMLRDIRKEESFSAEKNRVWLSGGKLYWVHVYGDDLSDDLLLATVFDLTQSVFDPIFEGDLFDLETQNHVEILNVVDQNEITARREFLVEQSNVQPSQIVTNEEIRLWILKEKLFESQDPTNEIHLCLGADKDVRLPYTVEEDGYASDDPAVFHKFKRVRFAT